MSAFCCFLLLRVCTVWLIWSQSIGHLLSCIWDHIEQQQHGSSSRASSTVLKPSFPHMSTGRQALSAARSADHLFILMSRQCLSVYLHILVAFGEMYIFSSSTSYCESVSQSAFFLLTNSIECCFVLLTDWLTFSLFLLFLYRFLSLQVKKRTEKSSSNSCSSLLLSFLKSPFADFLSHLVFCRLPVWLNVSVRSIFINIRTSCHIGHICPSVSQRTVDATQIEEELQQNHCAVFSSARQFESTFFGVFSRH